MKHENNETNHSLKGVVHMSSSNSWITDLLKITKIFIGQKTLPVVRLC